MAAELEDETDELIANEAIERDNATLTKRQRKVLFREEMPDEMREVYDVEEVPDSTKRAHRSKARKRIWNAIRDFDIVRTSFEMGEFDKIRELLKKDESELSDEEIIRKDMTIEGIYGMLEFAYEFEDVGDMPDMEMVIADVAADYHQRKVSHVIDSEHEHEFTVTVNIQDVPEDYDLVELVKTADRDISELEGQEKYVLSYYLSEDNRFRRMAEKQIGDGKVEFLLDSS